MIQTELDPHSDESLLAQFHRILAERGYIFYHGWYGVIKITPAENEMLDCQHIEFEEVREAKQFHTTEEAFDWLLKLLLKISANEFEYEDSESHETDS